MALARTGGLDFTLGRIDYSGSACFIGWLTGGAKGWQKGT
jgi:hypothetical protein